MNTAITRLDQMLYAWLAEPNDGKFERAFQKYYEAAFGGLVRYLARRAGSADLDFEQIAVDALLKFFCRAGRERRQASERVRGALPSLEPLDAGPIHVRQVRSWTAEVEVFRETAMSFRVIQDDTQDRDWKAEIHSLAESIPPLQQQGCHILNAVRTAVARILDSTRQLPDNDAPEDPGDESCSHGPIASFATRIRREASEDTAGAKALEAHHPGVLRFVDGGWTVIEALPLLRVPTNGYLFEIAQSLYLDECKARGRQKRGGSGVANTGNLAASADFVGASPHPVHRIDLQREISELEESLPGEHSVPVARGLAVELAESVDPISDRIGEEFCQQFYTYLCRPLEAAQHAYALAAAKGTASAERKALDSITRKTERVIAVLSMRIEGQSQNAIADSLGISRNQVKYIVEQMQEAYEQFAAACARTALRPPNFGAIPHVQ
jgi:DNA-directed RNA polymerase specialized sigma24 family protein